MGFHWRNKDISLLVKRDTFYVFILRGSSIESICPTDEQDE